MRSFQDRVPVQGPIGKQSLSQFFVCFALLSVLFSRFRHLFSFRFSCCSWLFGLVLCLSLSLSLSISLYLNLSLSLSLSLFLSLWLSLSLCLTGQCVCARLLSRSSRLHKLDFTATCKSSEFAASSFHPPQRPSKSFCFCPSTTNASRSVPTQASWIFCPTLAQYPTPKAFRCCL